jgi:hypothetical protein
MNVLLASYLLLQYGGRQKGERSAYGASFSLPDLPAKVSSLNTERPL